MNMKISMKYYRIFRQHYDDLFRVRARSPVRSLLFTMSVQTRSEDERSETKRGSLQT